MVNDGQHGIDSSSLGIVCTKDEALYAGVNNRSGAHGTGFNGHKELTLFKPVVSQGLGGFSKRDDLGVSGGVVGRDGAIGATAYDSSFADNDGADRNLAGGLGALSFAQGLFHPEFVRLNVVSHSMCTEELLENLALKQHCSWRELLKP